MSPLPRFLRQPGAELDVDDPRTTELRRDVIRAKPFLEAIYREWYQAVAAETRDGRVVEIGSGAGFLREVLPGVITSEVFLLRGLDLVCDAAALPFRNASVDTLVMVDVLHHVPRPREFFRDAIRALRGGGRIAMVEPWVTPWSRFVYSRFHPEPFRPDAETWEFPPAGPLSGANGALPWMMLVRDRDTFAREFPEVRVVRVEPMMPLRYLLSGGFSVRQLVPSWSVRFFRAMERAFAPLLPRLAMFALIVLERRD